MRALPRHRPSPQKGLLLHAVPEPAVNTGLGGDPAAFVEGFQDALLARGPSWSARAAAEAA